jgi:hypothetical protein
MVTKSITEALRASSEFANKLDDLVVGPNGLQFPIKNDGDWMLASQWAINASLHNSILSLFRDNLPAGAFSLLRPVSETLVRVHLIAMGDPQVIEGMGTDKFRTKFFEHPDKVDDHFQLGGAFKSVYDTMMNFLHSVTHIGMEQMKRQLIGNDLEPNYPERQIIGAVNMSTSVKVMVSSRVIERFRSVAEQLVVLDLSRDFWSR